MRAWLVSMVLVGALGGAVAGCHHDATAMCPQLDCKVSCPGGTRKDDNSGCPSCVCNGLPAPDGGADCPAVACSESCGLGFAVDATTGCPTCRCCFPADCQPGGCNGTGADGCPTCGPC